MRGLRAWLLRRSLNRELQKELQFHIDEHAHDLVASGLSPDEAKRRACIELGGADQIAERIRDGWPEAWLITSSATSAMPFARSGGRRGLPPQS